MMAAIARDALAEQLREASDADARDRILDQWIEWQFLATEWDADQWGLDPDNWMEEERAEMGRDTDPGVPIEPLMRIKP